MPSADPALPPDRPWIRLRHEILAGEGSSHVHARAARRPSRPPPRARLRDQAEFAGRRRPRPPRALGAPRLVARREDHLGGQQLAPRAARRAPRARPGHRLRPGAGAPGPRRPGDDRAVPGEPAPRAVRPRDRPARAAPLGADDRRHRGTRPGRAGRRPRGGDAGSTPTASPRPAPRPTPSTASCAWPRRSGPSIAEPRFVVAVGEADRRWARGALAEVARPGSGPEPGRPLADEALAPRALRRGRPAGRRGARGRPGGRRVARGPSAGRGAPRGCPTSPCSTSPGGRACRNWPRSRPSRTSSSPTTPARSTWPRRPVRGSSASTPARARAGPGPTARTRPPSRAASGAPPASSRPAPASNAWPSSPPTASGRPSSPSSKGATPSGRRPRDRVLRTGRSPSPDGSRRGSWPSRRRGATRGPWSRWRAPGRRRAGGIASRVSPGGGDRGPGGRAGRRRCG